MEAIIEAGRQEERRAKQARSQTTLLYSTLLRFIKSSARLDWAETKQD